MGSHKHDQDNESNGITKRIAKERPPCQRENFFAKERAHGNDKEYIKDSGSNNGSKANFGLGKGPKERGKQFGRGSSSRHEGCPGHVHAEIELSLGRHFFEGWHKEFVAGNGECEEHVQDTESIKDTEPAWFGLVEVAAIVVGDCIVKGRSCCVIETTVNSCIGCCCCLVRMIDNRLEGLNQ